MADVIRIKPYHYIHVLDSNTNVTHVVVGPQTFTRQEHQKVVFGPEMMITIPPRHYCTISNPVVRDDSGTPAKDTHGQFRLSHGDQEIRHAQDPFPLYPGESLIGRIQPLSVVAPNVALLLRVKRDFKVGDVQRYAGDEYLFEGPGTYQPRVEVKVERTVQATVIRSNQALKLTARKEFVDRNGITRKTGEEWLVRKEGAFLPAVEEQVLEVVDAVVLTDQKALHLRALRTFPDVFGKTRRAGEEWLVTQEMSESHIPDVYEEVVGEVPVTTLSNRQYCVVLDPVNTKTGKPHLGARELRVGDLSFFLRPGERLESGIQDIIVLSEDEALLLRAREQYKETDEAGKEVVRRPGDRWMTYGPADYVPPVSVEIVEVRQAIPLDENEGIYVRDIRSGKVRMVTNESYMLKPNEELWEKQLSNAVEDLLGSNPLSDRGNHGAGAVPFQSLRGKQSKGRAQLQQAAPVGGKRDKTRVVTYRAPHNSAVQVYDYKDKTSRVVFGPDLVMLGPDEEFTILSLSGGKPKKPNVIKSLALLLGPDFMTDIITVETSDHARLQLQLSYNWHFEVEDDARAKIFQVPDFVGDACKAVASRIRGAVASVAFDEFHKLSARVIRRAVFGQDEHGKIRDRFKFNANNLIITNIDIQNVEPVDQRTRDALQKSVQLAIEITTKSQEAAARHEAERIEQEARGRLERQRISDEAEAEKERKALLELRALSSAVESTGQAKAEAQARAEAQQIEGKAAVEQADLRAQSMRIASEAELEQQRKKQEAEIAFKREMDALELTKAKELAGIEASKFKNIVDAIGSETIRDMARAGPEMQVKLLQSLGLKSMMITDGNTPINLLNAANGLIGGNIGNAIQPPQ